MPLPNIGSSLTDLAIGCGELNRLYFGLEDLQMRGNSVVDLRSFGIIVDLALRAGEHSVKKVNRKKWINEST